MNVHDQVAREALHDWLNHRDVLRADEKPDPSEYMDDEEYRAHRICEDPDAFLDQDES